VYWHPSETHGSVRRFPSRGKQFLSNPEQLTLEKRSVVPDATMRIVSTINSIIETLRPTSVISNRGGTRRGHFGFPRPLGPADQTAGRASSIQPEILLSELASTRRERKVFRQSQPRIVASHYLAR
jgi:hypothetical protein